MNITPQHKQPFAEVTESSLSTWQAQAWQWDIFPAFGSLVTIETHERTIFGLVYHITTGSADSHRVTFAYKKTEEELKYEQPQIFSLLQTTFSCVTLGYLQDNILLYQLAPEPPKIHAFVTTASREQTVQFFSRDHYLHILFCLSSHFISLDEVLLSVLKNLSDLHLLTHTTLAQFIETFSLLTANDYRRLKLFLQRVQPILKIT